jgi:hypothetical protein
MHKRKFLFYLTLSVFSFLFSQAAFAFCSNPHGLAGDMVYNGDHDTMQFCNDTYWIAMGGGADNLGDHTATQALDMGGFGITGAAGVQVGNSTTCAAGNVGTIRYVGGATPWEYCTGSAWLPFKQPQCQDDATGGCYLESTRTVSDPQFLAANIKNGINILGVTGTMAAASGCPVFNGIDITLDIDMSCCDNVTAAASDTNYLYVATGAARLVAATFNGTTWTQVGSYFTPTGTTWELWKGGSYLYSAEAAAGVRAMSFNGTAFTNIALYNTPGEARGIWGDGTYIYVADGASGIRALTFNGTAWTSVAIYNTVGTATKIWGDGTYLYVVDDATANNILAFSFNGTAFTLLATHSIDNNARAIHGGGGYIYAASFTNAFVDLKALTFNGTAFTLRASLTLRDGFYVGVYVKDGYVYFAGQSATRVYTFDGTTFTLVGIYPYGAPSHVSDNYYIGAGFAHPKCN